MQVRAVNPGPIPPHAAARQPWLSHPGAVANPTWPWVVGGVAALGALGAGAYFLGRERGDDEAPTGEGTVGPPPPPPDPTPHGPHVTKFLARVQQGNPHHHYGGRMIPISNPTTTAADAQFSQQVFGNFYGHGEQLMPGFTARMHPQGTRGFMRNPATTTAADAQFSQQVFGNFYGHGEQLMPGFTARMHPQGTRGFMRNPAANPFQGNEYSHYNAGMFAGANPQPGAYQCPPGSYLCSINPPACCPMEPVGQYAIQPMDRGAAGVAHTGYNRMANPVTYINGVPFYKNKPHVGAPPFDPRYNRWQPHNPAYATMGAQQEAKMPCFECDTHGDCGAFGLCIGGCCKPQLVTGAPPRDEAASAARAVAFPGRPGGRVEVRRRRRPTARRTANPVRYAAQVPARPGVWDRIKSFFVPENETAAGRPALRAGGMARARANPVGNPDPALSRECDFDVRVQGKVKRRTSVQGMGQVVGMLEQMQGPAPVGNPTVGFPAPVGQLTSCPTFQYNWNAETSTVLGLPTSPQPGQPVPTLNMLTDQVYQAAYPTGPFPIPSNWRTIPACVPWAQAWLRLRGMIERLRSHSYYQPPTPGTPLPPPRPPMPRDNPMLLPAIQKVREAPAGRGGRWSGMRSPRRLSAATMNPEGGDCCHSCAEGGPCTGCAGDDHSHGHAA